MPEVVYFELNNWYAGRDYPNAEPFLSWMVHDLGIQFRDEQWVKENKLCVVASCVDMSQNFCITATREWVEKTCPDLLTEYTTFLRYPDRDGEVYGRFGSYFLTYSEDNIGISWYESEEDRWDEDEEDEND